MRLHERAGAGSATVTATLVVKLGARKYVAAVVVVVVSADSEHANSLWREMIFRCNDFIFIVDLWVGLSHHGNHEFQLSP